MLIQYLQCAHRSYTAGCRCRTSQSETFFWSKLSKKKRGNRETTYRSRSAAISSPSVRCWPGTLCLLKHQEKRKNPSESASRSKILVQRNSWDWENRNTHQTQAGRAMRRRAWPGRRQGRGRGTDGSEPSLAAAAPSSAEASWLLGEVGSALCSTLVD